MVDSEVDVVVASVVETEEEEVDVVDLGAEVRQSFISNSLIHCWETVHALDLHLVQFNLS